MTATLGCTFSIEDEDGGYWDWTYEAWLLDPTDTAIASGTNWVADKPGTTGSLLHTLTDPAEGTYTCVIDWTIEYTYLGQGRATQTVSYTIPTGETSSPGGWGMQEDDAAHQWNVTLIGGNFVGRMVQESNASAPGDNCHYDDSAVTYNQGITSPNNPWLIIADNKWNEPDVVGLGSAISTYYRNHDRAPCYMTTFQNMEINRPGFGYQSYTINTLKAGVTNITVWSERAGQPAERIWP